jgi:hypothetical protein
MFCVKIQSGKRSNPKFKENKNMLDQEKKTGVKIKRDTGAGDNKRCRHFKRNAPW